MYFGFGFGFVLYQINLEHDIYKQRLRNMMFIIQPSSDLTHIYGTFDLLQIILK
jgi:hypothetical protein